MRLGVAQRPVSDMQIVQLDDYALSVELSWRQKRRAKDSQRHLLLLFCIRFQRKDQRRLPPVRPMRNDLATAPAVPQILVHFRSAEMKASAQGVKRIIKRPLAPVR